MQCNSFYRFIARKTIAHIAQNHMPVMRQLCTLLADSGPLLPLPAQPYVVTMLAVNDPIKAGLDAAAATSTNQEARVWGLPWATVLASLGVDSSDAIWPPEGPRTLWTARLFPLLHPETSPPVLAEWWRWAQESLLSGRRPSP